MSAYFHSFRHLWTFQQAIEKSFLEVEGKISSPTAKFRLGMMVLIVCIFCQALVGPYTASPSSIDATWDPRTHLAGV